MGCSSTRAAVGATLTAGAEGLAVAVGAALTGALAAADALAGAAAVDATGAAGEAITAQAVPAQLVGGAGAVVAGCSEALGAAADGACGVVTWGASVSCSCASRPQPVASIRSAVATAATRRMDVILEVSSGFPMACFLRCGPSNPESQEAV